jgi:hypothetical protein
MKIVGEEEEKDDKIGLGVQLLEQVCPRCNARAIT